MLLDKNGKLFGRISFIDIAIVLFLVFAIGAGANHVQKNQTPDSFLAVTVTVNDVSAKVANALCAYTGEYTDAQGSIIGTAVSAHAEQEVTWEFPTDAPSDIDETMPETVASPENTADAEFPDSSENAEFDESALVAVPVPDSFDVTIELSCPGREDADFFRLSSGKPIAVGDLLVLTGGDTRVQVAVRSVALKSPTAD